MEYPDLTLAFYRRTKDTRFSSDTFRRFGFDRQLTHSNAIGAFFTNTKNDGLIMVVGGTPSSIPSNKGRRIPIYVWTVKARKRFSRVRALEEFMRD